MLFNVYVGNILYLQTLSSEKAFSLFGMWSKTNRSVRMEFIQAMKVSK